MFSCDFAKYIIINGVLMYFYSLFIFQILEELESTQPLWKHPRGLENIINGKFLFFLVTQKVRLWSK